MSLTPEKKTVRAKDTTRKSKLSKQKRLGIIVARKLAMGLDLTEREKAIQQVMATLNDEAGEGEG